MGEGFSRGGFVYAPADAAMKCMETTLRATSVSLEKKSNPRVTAGRIVVSVRGLNGQNLLLPEQNECVLQ